MYHLWRNGSGVDLMDEIWIMIQAGRFFWTIPIPSNEFEINTVIRKKQPKNSGRSRSYSRRVCAFLFFWDSTQNAWQWVLHQGLVVCAWCFFAFVLGIVIKPIVAVYILIYKNFLVKVERPIPNIRSWSTLRPQNSDLSRGSGKPVIDGVSFIRHRSSTDKRRNFCSSSYRIWLSIRHEATHCLISVGFKYINYSTWTKTSYQSSSYPRCKLCRIEVWSWQNLQNIGSGEWTDNTWLPDATSVWWGTMLGGKRAL